MGRQHIHQQLLPHPETCPQQTPCHSLLPSFPGRSQHLWLENKLLLCSPYTLTTCIGTPKLNSSVFLVFELRVEHKLCIPSVSSFIYPQYMLGRFIKFLSVTVVHEYSCIFHCYMIINYFPFCLGTLGLGLLAMVCLITFPNLSLGMSLNMCIFNMRKNSKQFFKVLVTTLHSW